MGGAKNSVPALCTFQDFYLRLVLDWAIEQKYLCGWSTSGVLLEQASRFGSPEGIQVQLYSVHQSGICRSGLGQLFQNGVPRSIWNTNVCAPPVMLVLFLGFWNRWCKTKFFSPVLFCGSFNFFRMEISILLPLFPWLLIARSGVLLCSLVFLTSELSRWCLKQTSRGWATDGLAVFFPVSAYLFLDCLGHLFSQHQIPLGVRGVQESNAVLIFWGPYINPRQQFNCICHKKNAIGLQTIYFFCFHAKLPNKYICCRLWDTESHNTH